LEGRKAEAECCTNSSDRRKALREERPIASRSQESRKEVIKVAQLQRIAEQRDSKNCGACDDIWAWYWTTLINIISAQ